MSSPTVFYRAPLATSVKLLTAGAYSILAGVGALAVVIMRLGPIPMLAGIIALATVSVIGLASLGFRVRGYLLTGYELLIRFGFGSRSVQLGEIAGIEPATEIFRESLRVFASGGLWSFLGKFNNPRVGAFDSYVSDPARAVMISTGSERMVVSPEDRDGFIDELKRRRPALP